MTSCTKRLKQASSSMEPTIRAGEMVSVDRLHSPPKRWDVIVFESPLSGKGHWISRIVGVPGETVDIHSGQLVVNGRVMPLPKHVKIGKYRRPTPLPSSSAPGPISFPYKLRAGRYFVLSDNVSNALDSRYWGGLDESKILGIVPGK
ncbi:signal peptidase I [Verrucomicrobiaceae bacterium E54]|nr:signal peptidase I [Verrucomicrobiaceae bacterium E54]